MVKLHLRTFLFTALVASAVLFVLIQRESWRREMPNQVLDTLLLGALLHRVAAECSVENSMVNLNWHAPAATDINNLGAVINGTGVFGFIFNSSLIPTTTSYGTYNWCNMPHVRPQEYKVPPPEYKLQYVELVRQSWCLVWL